MRKFSVAIISLVAVLFVASPLVVSAQTLEGPTDVSQPVICVEDGDDPLEDEECDTLLTPEQEPEDGRPEKGETSHETVAGTEEVPPQVLGATTAAESNQATLAQTGHTPLLATVVGGLIILSTLGLSLVSAKKH